MGFGGWQEEREMILEYVLKQMLTQRAIVV